MTIYVAYPYWWRTRIGGVPLSYLWVSNPWCQKIKMQQSMMNPTTNHVNIFIYKKQFYKKSTYKQMCQKWRICLCPSDWLRY